jgi:ABC-type multidrug transport system fused ATPase/permease subunit
MIIATLSNLGELVDNAGRRLVILSSAAALTSLLEAFVLVVVVRVAVGMASGDSSIVIGPVTADGPAWLIAAAMSLLPSALLHYYFARQAAALSADVLERARGRIGAAFVRASLDRQAAEAEGTLQHAATTLSEQTSYLAFLVVIGGTSLLNLTVLMLVALVVSWQTTIVIVATGSALFAALSPLSKRTRAAAKGFVATNTRYAEAVAQQASISLETRTLGVELERIRVLDQRAGVASRSLRHTRFEGLLGSFVYRDVALAALLILLSLAFGRTSGRLADVGPAILLIVRSLSYAQGMQNARQVLSEHGENTDVLLAYIEQLEHSEWHTGNLDLPRHPAVVELIGVTYRYPEAATDALHAVDVRIEPGEAVGLVGPSGSGKSTLVQLVLGLRRPTSGRLTVAGIDLERVRGDALPKWSAVVPQDVNLITGSIIENVRFFRDWVSVSDAKRALARAHVLDEIEALPDGLATQLGPRGLGLSGGQRQRVGIARALAGDASLIVLDEPTSALDPVSELRIRETMEELKGSVTLLIVAHRPATLEVCDRVIEVRDGMVTGG